MEANKVDLAFSTVVTELCPDVSPEEYVDFDAELSTADPEINVNTLVWRHTNSC